MVRVTVEVQIPGLLTAEEMAEKLDWGIATVWRWINDGKMISVRLGKPERVLVPESEIARCRALREASEKK